MLATNPVNKEFILAHPDAFYTNGILVAVLEMISACLLKGQIPRDRFLLKFVNGRPEQQIIDTLGLETNIAFGCESPSFKDRLKDLSDSDAILFIQRAAGGNFASEAFYPLLTLRKKILAIVPNPVTYREIAQNEEGLYVASLDCQEEIAHLFLRMYRDWQEEQLALTYNSAA